VRLYPCLVSGSSLTTYIHRGTHKKDPLKSSKWQDPNEVQGPVFTVPLHTIGGRPREGGETKAELAPWCVRIFSALLFFVNMSNSAGLTIVEIDKPKKK